MFDKDLVLDIRKSFPLYFDKIIHINNYLKYKDKIILDSCEKALNSGDVILSLKKSLGIKNEHLKIYTINYLTYVLCGSLRQSFVNEVVFKKNNSYVLPIFCFLNNFTSKLLTDILDDLQDYNKQNLIDCFSALKSLFLSFALKKLRFFKKERSINKLILQLNGVILSLDRFDSLLKIFHNKVHGINSYNFKINSKLKDISIKIEEVVNFINERVEDLYSNNNYIEVLNINVGSIKTLFDSTNIIFSKKCKSYLNSVLNIVNELKEEDVKRKLQNEPKEKPTINLQVDTRSKYSFFKLNYWW